MHSSSPLLWQQRLMLAAELLAFGAAVLELQLVAPAFVLEA